jgi:hypothetical protein
MSSPLGTSLKRAFSQPSFLVVAGILLIAAAGLNGATRFMQLHFRKLPVPMQKELADFPTRLGPWRQVSIDVPLSHDFEEVLQTKKYIFRTYVDTRIFPDAELDKIFKDKSPNQCDEESNRLVGRNDQGVVRLMLTYYTGLVDTVAHVPDRCMTAGGYEPTRYETPKWNALKDLPGDGMVRFIVFEDMTTTSRGVPQNVSYFFNCNGEYTNDSIRVRTRLADLFQRYGYYMKIETHMIKTDGDNAARVKNDLLSYALPVLKDFLPNWDDYKSKR